MNKKLFDIYSTNKILDILNNTNYRLETSHDLIQTIFPLKEASAYNYEAPLLDNETIKAMKESEVCMNNMKQSCIRLYDFLVSNQYCSRPHWVNSNNHNYLRITRIIKCCKIFGLDEQAKMFYNMAMEFYRLYPLYITEETIKYWSEAFNYKDSLK